MMERIDPDDTNHTNPSAPLGHDRCLSGVGITGICPGLQQTVSTIDALQTLFDRHSIGEKLAVTAGFDAETLSTFETVLTQFNSTLNSITTLGAYIRGFTTTNSRETFARCPEASCNWHW